MSLLIRLESPASPDAIRLVDELESHLAAQYPATSRHGYSVEKLIREGVAFFVARWEGEPVGCGGVQHCADGYGELKRMYVRPEFRGRGVARALLERLTVHAVSEGAGLLRLETGVHQREAIALYTKAGFRSMGPFGQYQPDPNSVFLEKALA